MDSVILVLDAGDGGWGDGESIAIFKVVMDGVR